LQTASQKGDTRMIRKAIISYLIIMIISPPLTAGAATIPGFYGTVRSPLRAVGATQLPVLKSPNEKIKDGEYVIDDTTTANRMVINQQRDKIVVDWKSFDIGSSASVHFDQRGNTNWAALNRIWDASPSQIYGRLTADGKIYLLNQNGILFAPGSQVNIHTLIASSLNLSKSDFMNNTLNFNRNQEQGETFYDLNNIPGTETNPGVVTNLGTITAKDQGSVFLIGPNVENGGTIEANLGQIGLIAGYDLELVKPVSGTSTLTYPKSGKGTSETRTALFVKMTQSPNGATAWNMEGGSLGADQGHVGMYGGIVNQDGLVRSVTAVQRAGHVELMASQRITTGANSWIATPVSSSAEKFANVDTLESTIVLSGLDSTRPSDPLIYPSTIEHRGRIDAPQGYVELRATDRVYFGSGSTIDVSGLWIDKSASDQLVTASMTSVNLRDAFMQKNGILKGQSINMGALTGSSIGDVSGSFSEGLTAVERHTQGGHVVVGLIGNREADNSIATGDFIMREGSAIDFSGGGFRYAAGTANTTVLVSGNKIYNIGTADPNIRYDKIMNIQKIIHQRQGITDTYEGIYYGGVIPLGMGLPAHTQGSNAGSFSIGATQAVLDGTIKGSAEKGIYQYLAANPTTNDSQIKSGFVEPMAGELYLGNTDAIIIENDSLDRYFGNIVVSGRVSPILSPNFTSTDDLSQILDPGKTVLSSVALNNAGLSKIYLAANKTVTIEKDANISLVPARQEQADGTARTSTLEIAARRIEHFGTITVPGGDIKLVIEGNKTTNPADEDYVSLNERIFLADGSALDVKGERVDNRLVANAGSIRLGAHTTGGSITILDRTVNRNIDQQEGVAVSKGARLDVSGGWLTNAAGKVSGADAGSIALQGYSLFIDGDFRGYSLTGNKGGTISMQAGDISVGAVTTSLPEGFASDSRWPDSSRGHLTLGADRFNKTGFSNIVLRSLTDLIVERGVHLRPSLAKMAITGAIITAIPDNAGPTSIALSAGSNFNDLANGTRYNDMSGSPLKREHPEALLRILPDAVIELAPGGSIATSGPSVDIYGTLSAPAGSIAIASTLGDLTLHNGANVLAEGYNKRTSAPLKNLPLEYSPLSAGSITVQSFDDLNIETAVLLSVAGSSPVRRAQIGQNLIVSSYTDAGKAGSIALTAFDITLEGVLKGHASMAERQGGSLAITKKATDNPFTVSATDLAGYQSSGFDALTLASEGTLAFVGPIDMTLGRSLKLNARRIIGSDAVGLSAPWVQVAYNPITVDINEVSPLSGNALLRLNGQFLDITGDVVFSGFSNVLLHADRDMRLTDFKYGGAWKGLLRTAGDLTLEAARIYPTTQSVFVMETSGKTTILPSGSPTAGPIYSAAGSLTIKAGGGIEHRGYIAAPLGAISLEATGTGLSGRVYLADGSVTSTRGDFMVKYGTIDPESNYSWIVTDRNNMTKTIESAPEKSISLKGVDAIAHKGAYIDMSGGGGIFSSIFEPSVSGTNNPLLKTNNGKTTRWVILPDNSVTIPGSAVYLAGGNGLKAGVYSLLDTETYAFLPGAMVLTDLNMGLVGAKPTRTKEGYTIVSGYETVTGTNIQSGQMKAYSLRSASDVLTEGMHITKSVTAGNGGALLINAANSAVIDGNIKTSAQTGFKAGGLYVGGNHVVLQSSVPPLPTDFGFSSPIPIDLAGTVNVNQSLLSGNTFGTISLGYDPAAADHIVSTTVTLREGTILEAETVFLGARERITMEKDSQVSAIASNGRRGEVTFSSPLGEVVTGEGSVVHVSDAINLDTTNLNLHPDATFMSDHSELNLTGPKITFVQDGYNRTGNDRGLLLTDRQFVNFSSSFENIGLKSTSDITFNGDFALSVTDTLTIDTGLVQSIGGGSVKFAASTINIFNTAATPSIEEGSAGLGVITFTAANTTGSTESSIYIGKGTVLFDGFAAVNLRAQNDLMVRGTGTLNTGNADLSITATRVATNYYMDNGTYTAPNFTINAGSGAVDMVKTPGGGAGGDSAAPGSLEIKAGTIDISTFIETPAGQIKLTAADNITFNDGAKLHTIGNGYAPGGDVILTSTGGGVIDINETYDELGDVVASIDVSGGMQGDAGSIKFYAPTGGVSLNGEIRGQAHTQSDGTTGLGGSFDMVTNQLSVFSSINEKLTAGGFNETLGIRADTGSINITEGDTVRARNVKISADGGNLTLNGSINTSRGEGEGDAGTVDLSAWNNLTIASTGNIDAGSASGKGGEVSLNAGHVQD
jgi:filamentous hemagglutinin